MIPQNYHSDVTRWGHCGAAVWSCCGITLWDHCDTSWTYYFALFYSYVSVISQNYHSDVTGWWSLWCCCVAMLWDHCDIMDILICIIYSYVSVISQNNLSDVTKWGHCDAAEWVLQELPWHHGFTNVPPGGRCVNYEHHCHTNHENNIWISSLWIIYWHFLPSPVLC